MRVNWGLNRREDGAHGTLLYADDTILDTKNFTVLTRYYAPFVYKPPLTNCMNLLLRYIYLQFMPPLASATPTNERKVRTHCTILYMKSSYLLASDIPTSDWLRGGRLVSSWWWCIAFSDRSHSAPSLIISWSFALQNWATTSFITSCTRRQFCHFCFPHALHREERGRINETNYHYSIISPPPHTCS